MSLDCGQLCSAILEDNYGSVIKSIAETLFPTTWRSFQSIITETKLPEDEIADGLAIMIKNNFVVFRVSVIGRKPVVEYSLQYDQILWTLRYARYVHFMKEKYGPPGQVITYALLTAGPQSASEMISECLKASAKVTIKGAKEFRAIVHQMITEKYLIRLPDVSKKPPKSYQLQQPYPAPCFVINDELSFEMPKLSLASLTTLPPRKAKDKNILFRINNGRFHQEFRDEIIVEAVKNKLGAIASECVEVILKFVYQNEGPWLKHVSGHFSSKTIKEYVNKHSTNQQLKKYMNHYLTLLATDSLGVIRNINNNINDALFVVDWAKIFFNLTASALEDIVEKRFGPKARRIFSIVRLKPFIEQSELHKHVMMSDKECKLATYTLIKENFINIRTVRKIGTGGVGQSYISYLFHVKMTKLVQSLLNTCYKSIRNHILRAIYVKKQNHLIMDKIMEVNTTTPIQAKYILTEIDRTYLAKIQNNIIVMLAAVHDIDETIFLFEMYLYHSTSVELVRPFLQFNITE